MLSTIHTKAQSSAHSTRPPVLSSTSSSRAALLVHDSQSGYPEISQISTKNTKSTKPAYLCSNQITPSLKASLLVQDSQSGPPDDLKVVDISTQNTKSTKTYLLVSLAIHTKFQSSALVGETHMHIQARSDFQFLQNSPTQLHIHLWVAQPLKHPLAHSGTDVHIPREI